MFQVLVPRLALVEFSISWVASVPVLETFDIVWINIDEVELSVKFFLYFLIVRCIVILALLSLFHISFSGMRVDLQVDTSGVLEDDFVEA